MIPAVLKKILTVPSGDDDLTLAQYQANTRQLPMMYVLLLVNTWALMASFWHAAPDVLVLYIPAGLTALAVLRLVYWHKKSRDRVEPADALKSLQKTNIIGGILAACFGAWCLSLFPYGDPYAKGHVAFYMGITVVSCIFSLMHIRSAAIIVTVIVNVTFVGFFGFSGNQVFVAKALNIAFVSVVMLAALWAYYERFVSLISSQRQLFEQKEALIQKQAETLALSNRNYQLANRDSLTNLPNRRCFFAEFEHRVQSAISGKVPLVVGLIDLDGFKGLNDMYGHAVGDKILTLVAERFEKTSQGEIFLSRLGGDEFAVLIDLDVSDEELLQIGENFCAALETPFVLEEGDLNISSCAGFARCLENHTMTQLYEMADFALYRAKRAREKKVVLFNDDHEKIIRRTKQLDTGLRSPSIETELLTVFQPMVDAATGKVLAFEALARWTSPVLGNVSPADFIPAAERNGFIGPLTLILFRKALAAAKNWPASVHLSFNLSANNITSEDFVGKVIEEVSRSEVDATRIEFEITETALIRDHDQVQAAIARFKELGILISLDDFGTGYSSLTHLHQFPLDKIKIDRSFVSGIDGCNPAGYGIVKSMLNLSKEMQIGCVIEGIETAGELAIVRKLGGELVQGYYYSKPLMEKDALQYLAEAPNGPRAELSYA